jgi:hypothetical protein
MVKISPWRCCASRWSAPAGGRRSTDGCFPGSTGGRRGLRRLLLSTALGAARQGAAQNLIPLLAAAERYRDMR